LLRSRHLQLQAVVTATCTPVSKGVEGVLSELRLVFRLVLSRARVLFEGGSGHSGLSSDFGSADSLLALQVSVDGVIQEHVVLVEVVLGLNLVELRLSSEAVLGVTSVLNVLFKLVHGARRFLAHVLLLGQVTEEDLLLPLSV